MMQPKPRIIHRSNANPTVPKFSYRFSDPQDVDYWFAKDYESEAEFAQFLAQEIDSQVVEGLRLILGS
jgi:hypothetical protein